MLDLLVNEIAGLDNIEMFSIPAGALTTLHIMLGSVHPVISLASITASFMNEAAVESSGIAKKSIGVPVLKEQFSKALYVSISNISFH